MVAILPTSAAVFAGSLVISSLRNICQTSFLQSQQKELSEGESSLIYRQIIGAHENKSDDEVLKDLKNLSRKELLGLYLFCSDPSDIRCAWDGEWRGELLDNGLIMVSMLSFFSTED